MCPQGTVDNIHDLFSDPHAKRYEDLITPTPEELIKVQESYESGESYDSDDEQNHWGYD